MQLILNTFGSSLRRKGELFLICAGGRKVEVSARKIDSILVTTGAHFSSDAVRLAVEHNIDIVLLDRSGRPYGRFWMSHLGGTAAVRRGQFRLTETRDGLEIIRSWTTAKLRNQRRFLEELGRRRPARAHAFNAAIRGIEAQNDRLVELKGTVDQVRPQILTAEAAAANIYWRLLGTLPPAVFRFQSRTRHPARDPFNAMLNYAYGVLYSEVERACLTAGLDPFVGILHTDNYGKRSLVYDLVEPFRVWADRVVLKLFTGRRCRLEMFRRQEDGAVFLDKPGKELLLPALQEFLDARIQYPVKSGKKLAARRIRRRAAIQAEAHALANRILGRRGVEPEVLETEELFHGPPEP